MPKNKTLDIPQEKILTDDIRASGAGLPASAAKVDARSRADDELTPEEIPPIKETLTKPKRQISDAQREHLNNLRVKAMQKKEEMKEETLKQN